MLWKKETLCMLSLMHELWDNICLILTLLVQAPSMIILPPFLFSQQLVANFTRSGSKRLWMKRGGCCFCPYIYLPSYVTASRRDSTATTAVFWRCDSHTNMHAAALGRSKITQVSWFMTGSFLIRSASEKRFKLDPWRSSASFSHICSSSDFIIYT